MANFTKLSQKIVDSVLNVEFFANSYVNLGYFLSQFFNGYIDVG